MEAQIRTLDVILSSLLAFLLGQEILSKHHPRYFSLSTRFLRAPSQLDMWNQSRTTWNCSSQFTWWKRLKHWANEPWNVTTSSRKQKQQAHFLHPVHNLQFWELLYCILAIEFLSAAAEQAVWVVDQFSLHASTKKAATQKHCIAGPKMTLKRRQKEVKTPFHDTLIILPSFFFISSRILSGVSEGLWDIWKGWVPFSIIITFILHVHRGFVSSPNGLNLLFFSNKKRREKQFTDHCRRRRRQSRNQTWKKKKPSS